MSSAEQTQQQQQPTEKKRAAWRSSLYDEPVWVSVAWIAVPLGAAAVGVFFAMT